MCLSFKVFQLLVHTFVVPNFGIHESIFEYTLVYKQCYSTLEHRYGTEHNLTIRREQRRTFVYSHADFVKSLVVENLAPCIECMVNSATLH